MSCAGHMCAYRKQSAGQPTQLLTKRTRPLLLRLFSQVGTALPQSFFFHTISHTCSISCAV